ncbi:MAG: hypothetical protein ACREIA_11105 [Opitutaceae bacterium]
MASDSTYLNFPGTTEQAFAFYKSVFKTDYAAPIARFADMPADAGSPPVSERLLLRERCSLTRKRVV